MALKKMKDSKLDDTSELTKQRAAFKALLTQTEQMMKKIWKVLSQSIKYVYDQIEKENQSYLNLINENTNLAESSYTDIEKLVNIVERSTLNDWNAQKNSYMKELDQTKSWWDQHRKGFIEKSNQGIEYIQKLVKQELEIISLFFEMLTYLQAIDESLYKKIHQILTREKVSDILGFLSKTNNQRFFESLINTQANLKDVKKNSVEYFGSYHKFNKEDFSSETYEKARSDLIKGMKDNKGIIDFIKFLVLLTSIDGKFIQCGSNALNLNVDMRNESLNNIRIENTSLIEVNFVRCNLSGSELDNVDISGLNSNRALLFNCKWKKLKIK
ncbi:unnamed protein product [Paramecium pentaurelia]|uniref:Pentapeptide repeat-containing protein n=1 Tax=Paramecium pentaurelia TaxID=43138 RepID=A0A8S1UC69_9CILI|nr:unnamed protein product [Paramecium pentaurelia]